MKNWKPLALGTLVAAAVATATLVSVPARTARAVAPLSLMQPVPPGKFDPRQSAALFVGVSEFDNDETMAIPYAVDDAVDLAYLFSLDPHVRLVPPQRVVLALSGKPQKNESRLLLETLKDAGVQVASAYQSDILSLVEKQATAAGPNGMLILSIATHGFATEGVPYILAQSSILADPATALSAARIFDSASQSRAKRSLILVDACRERIAKGARAGNTETTSAAPVLRQMPRASGQVIFYAAAPGGYSYDNRGNGVFTKAVIDGLNCKARTEGGVVTVDSLHKYVEREVRSWIQKHKDPAVDNATQISIDGAADSMPLACCAPALCGPPPERCPQLATSQGSKVTALSSERTPLWTHDTGSEIVQALAADLETDGCKEIIVGTRKGILALDRDAIPLWEGQVLPSSESIARLDVIDHRQDGHLDINVTTMSGGTVVLDVHGNVLEHRRAQFIRSHPRDLARAVNTSPPARLRRRGHKPRPGTFPVSGILAARESRLHRLDGE